MSDTSDSSVLPISIDEHGVIHLRGDVVVHGALNSVEGQQNAVASQAQVAQSEAAAPGSGYFTPPEDLLRDTLAKRDQEIEELSGYLSKSYESYDLLERASAETKEALDNALDLIAIYRRAFSGMAATASSMADI